MLRQTASLHRNSVVQTIKWSTFALADYLQALPATAAAPIAKASGTYMRIFIYLFTISVKNLNENKRTIW